MVDLTGQICIVRSRWAGVHVGRVVARDGLEVELADATRVWRWRGANTLSELSLRGADREYTRIAEPVTRIVLTEATEIIPCTDAAADNLRTPRWPS